MTALGFAWKVLHGIINALQKTSTNGNKLVSATLVGVIIA
jgi:hypothetical protein